jgi:hypothetical protein
VNPLKNMFSPATTEFVTALSFDECVEHLQRASSRKLLDHRLSVSINGARFTVDALAAGNDHKIVVQLHGELSPWPHNRTLVRATLINKRAGKMTLEQLTRMAVIFGVVSFFLNPARGASISDNLLYGLAGGLFMFLFVGLLSGSLINTAPSPDLRAWVRSILSS